MKQSIIQQDNGITSNHSEDIQISDSENMVCAIFNGIYNR